MRTPLLAALIIALSPTLALADRTETSERTVKAGATVRIGNWYLVNTREACKAGPVPTTAVSKPPSLGQLSFEQVQEEPRDAKCKGNIVPQVAATYRAGTKPGTDEMVFRVVFAPRTAEPIIVRQKITVQ